MPPKQTLDFQSFVIEYERRHADLEQRFAVQSAEQKMRDEQATKESEKTAKELACLHEGIDDIKRILNNGLMTRVSSLEESMKVLAVRVNTKPKILSWDFWQPVIRDFVRVAILLGIVIALQNAPKFVSAFGISVP